MGMISKRTNKEACGKWKVRTRHQRFFIYDFKAHNTIVQFLSSFSFDPSSSPCYIHFPFLLQQLRDRKLYLISTWVKTLLNSWAFWHKSQTSASPKVKLKYDREKKRRGWSKEPRVLLGCMYGKCKSLQQSCQKKLSLVCFTTLVFAHHKVSRQIGSSPGQQASQSAVPSSLMGKRRGNEWPFATQALLFPWS